MCGTDDRLCASVVIGVNARGETHFLAIKDGARERTQSWREILLGLKSRGLNAPKLAVDDGAMGFWAALEDVYPTTESAFATIRHRRKRTKGCLSRDGMLLMMFKLGQCAEKSWRKLRGFAHLADVIEGVIEGINPSTQDQAAA